MPARSFTSTSSEAKFFKFLQATITNRPTAGEMAGNQLIVIVSLLLVLPLALPFATASPEIPKQPDVVVEGMVYCQSCQHQGTWSLTDAKPILSARVSVICKDKKERVSFYKVFSTDENGYFYAQLEGFKMSHSLLEHPLQSCQVKPVSSPLESCNLLSNVNYGMYGSPLRYENKRLVGRDYEAVIYAAGPLAFRPAHCTPMTHF